MVGVDDWRGRRRCGVKEEGREGRARDETEVSARARREVSMVGWVVRSEMGWWVGGEKTDEVDLVSDPC